MLVAGFVGQTAVHVSINGSINYWTLNCLGIFSNAFFHAVPDLTPMNQWLAYFEPYNVLVQMGSAHRAVSSGIIDG